MTIVLDPQPDWRVLVVTLGFCVLSVFLFALGPACEGLQDQRPSQLRSRSVIPTAHGKSTAACFPAHPVVVGQLALSLGY